jgi:hypothetical protein
MSQMEAQSTFVDSRLPLVLPAPQEPRWVKTRRAASGLRLLWAIVQVQDLVGTIREDDLIEAIIIQVTG